nr:MAG TPA: hypothetical protein [Caudoviricetes sp.]
MNKSIVEFYGIAANCDIAKEEAAEFIHAISKWERATLPVHFETDTMSDEAKENLIQAADRQDAMNILVYRLKFNKSAIRQEIKDADERPKRLYGRRYEMGNIIRFMLTRHGETDEREKF